MATYKISAELNLKKIIEESKEVAQALNEFADNLERIEKKYAELHENEKADKCDNDHDCEHCDWVECPEMKGDTNGQ